MQLSTQEFKETVEHSIEKILILDRNVLANDLIYKEEMLCIDERIKNGPILDNCIAFIYSADFESNCLHVQETLNHSHTILNYVLDNDLNNLPNFLSNNVNIDRIILYFDIPSSNLDSDFFEKLLWQQLHLFFDLIKIIIQHYLHKNLSLDVYTVCRKNIVHHPLISIISGLLASLSKEMTQWQIKHMDLDTFIDLKQIKSYCPGMEQSIFYHEGRYWVKDLVKAKCIETEPFLQQTGTYLILGNMANISQKLAEFLIYNFYATVIIVGQKNLDDAGKDFIHAFENKIEFIQSDICKQNQCDLLIKYIGLKYPALTAVFDLILEVDNNRLETMNWSMFHNKVKSTLLGGCFIKQLHQKLQIKSAIIFSSMQSYDCSPGQSHTAAASCGLDTYAKYLGTLPNLKVKRINLETWQEETLVRGLNSQFHDFALQKRAVKEQTSVPVLEAVNDLVDELMDIELSKKKVPLDIAIVGMAGLFPQATSIEALWQLLCSGKNAISLPEQRPAIMTEPNHAGWLNGLSNVEMNQESLFMHVVNAALKDASLDPHSLPDKSCAVFVGASHQKEPNVFSSNSSDIATQISHTFHFSGPALTIDTACSSALVAIHQACMAIYNGECKSALAGGVFVMLDDSWLQQAYQANLLSATHRCQTFNANANGIVLGEAVACIYLKPLSAALKEGDKIYAIIKGSGVNQSNKTPELKGLAQTQLIQEIYARYHLSTSQLAYVEVHGSGCYEEDCIEVNALAAAFVPEALSNSCALGSIKTNIGHSMHAAGISAFIKLILAAFNKKIPPNCEAENPHMDFANTPFFPVKTMMPWPQEKSLGAVSSFGFSGTNAHIVIQQFNKAYLLSSNEPQLTSKPSVNAPFPKSTDIKNLALKIADETELIDFCSYLSILVFLHSHQQTWIKKIFKMLKLHRPPYYIFVDDKQQFYEALNSLTPSLSPIIYYFASIPSYECLQENLTDFVKRLHLFPKFSAYIYSIHSDAAKECAKIVKKEYSYCNLEWINNSNDLFLALRLSSDKCLNELISELEHFCYHLVKHKLVSQGLIWSESNPSFLMSVIDYKEFASTLINLCKEFEKIHYAKTNKNHIKTWDNLLQQRLELSKKYPAALPLLNLLAVCADQLVSILRDEKSIKDILFPYGEDHLLRAVHLMISSNTVNSLFLIATFGLCRPDYASVSRTLATWKTILNDLGFEVKDHPISNPIHQPIIFATYKNKAYVSLS